MSSCVYMVVHFVLLLLDKFSSVKLERFSLILLSLVSNDMFELFFFYNRKWCTLSKYLHIIRQLSLSKSSSLKMFYKKKCNTCPFPPDLLSNFCHECCLNMTHMTLRNHQLINHNCQIICYLLLMIDRGIGDFYYTKCICTCMVVSFFCHTTIHILKNLTNTCVCNQLKLHSFVKSSITQNSKGIHISL